jgi:hypothetical protein
MSESKTTPLERKREAAKGLLDHLAQYETLNCYAAVNDVVRFAQNIYDEARRHQREDGGGVANER